MFQFSSKPIAITPNSVLCSDGSIWRLESTGEYVQIAEYKRTMQKPKDKILGPYHKDFERFWFTWRLNIKNACSKPQTYEKWRKLSEEEKSRATEFIFQYSKSSTDHQYLKRAITYLSGKIWESFDHIEEASKSVMPPLSNIVWNKEIYNQDTGITDKARDQVSNFGMSLEEAWRLINDQ